MNKNFKIHDFKQGSTALIDWNPGDYTVHDYGRGGLEVGIIMDNGRIYGIADEIVNETNDDIGIYVTQFVCFRQFNDQAYVDGLG